MSGTPFARIIYMYLFDINVDITPRHDDLVQ